MKKDALDKYTRLHHLIFRLTNGFKNWRLQAITHRKTLEKFIAEAEQLNQKILQYGTIAGFSNEELASLEEKEYRLKPAELRKEVLTFRDEFNDFYNAFKPFVEAFDPLENEYKEYNVLFEEFDRQYFFPLTQKENNIDVVSLDDDYNNMRTELPGALEKARDVAIDEFNTLPHEYQAFVPQIDKMFRRLELIFENIKIWEDAHKGNDEEKSIWN